MPELPEVETTLRGVAPHLAGRRVTEVIVRQRSLRLPVPSTLDGITDDRFTGSWRRAKYLIFELERTGALLVHLGMSGSLRLAERGADFRKHDHVAITLDSGRQLRFHDPRRFGIFLHLPDGEAGSHPLLKDLGPEPLGPEFSAVHLARACAGRNRGIKLVIMDHKTVVGVGNIYASEALFRAGIRPDTPAAKVSRFRIAKLVDGIRTVLTESIEQGGTTLRDFLHSHGEPGYFQQRLFVYGRNGESCRKCGAVIRHAVIGQRSTYWCPRCQK